MTFLTRNRIVKFLKIFAVLFSLIFILVLLNNTRNLNHSGKDRHKEEKSNFHNSNASNFQIIPPTNQFKGFFSGKEQHSLVVESSKLHTIKSSSEVNYGNAKPPILFKSKFQESCLKKYLLDVQLFNDPERILELVTKNVSQAYMFTSFHRIAEALGIKACIIEPSILYCMLPTKYRELLAKRNYDLRNYTKSSDIITFGIFEEDVTILQKEENINEFRSIGLQPYFFEQPIAPWMKEESIKFQNDKYTSHIFYMYYTWTIHIVVFYRRHNYLWHSELNLDNSLRFLPGNNLLFMNYDSAYENFDFDSILSRNSSFSSIYIPSSPHYFLFQIPSSRFLECNSSRAAFIDPNSASISTFNENTLIALRELKTFFQNELRNFWIFSGTLLGWYRQCGVIPYTNDVDFGAWASEIDDLNATITYFRENKKLHLLERMGLLEEALEFQLRCNSLRVDVFFMYKVDNGTWASGHRPSKGYYFRYHYPFFTLCSAELLEEKVQVPCEAEDLILIEYGKEWMHPVSTWDYESSIYNRGPNIYWDEKIRPETFQSY